MNLATAAGSLLVSTSSAVAVAADGPAARLLCQTASRSVAIRSIDLPVSAEESSFFAEIGLMAGGALVRHPVFPDFSRSLVSTHSRLSFLPWRKMRSDPL